MIEATFSVLESITRGVPIYYTYEVQNRRGSVKEIASRCVYIPTDNTVKGTEMFFGNSLYIIYVMSFLICDCISS